MLQESTRERANLKSVCRVPLPMARVCPRTVRMLGNHGGVVSGVRGVTRNVGHDAPLRGAPMRGALESPAPHRR
eukprot:1762235-Prymnesium_polylepis.1